MKTIQAPEYIDMDTSCFSIIQQMQALIDKYGPTVRVSLEQEAWGDGYENNVYYEREETDEECELRVEMESRYDQNKKERELQMLKTLQAKYGVV